MDDLTPVSLEHEGAALEGRMALPAGEGPHPAVLVMANAHGLGPNMAETAARLAALGYVALATDMYGGGAYHDDHADITAAITPLWTRPELLRSRVVAWFDALRARPEVDPARVAAIGYCFGGQCVLELARSGADVRTVVSYHGLLKTALPAAPGVVKAKVAVFTGARDPHVPQADVLALREEMIAAGADWQIAEFGTAYHSFTDYRRPEAPVDGQAFNPLANAMSWAATLVLLDHSLRQPGASTYLRWG